MYKGNKAGRRILAAFLATVMAVPLLTGVMHKDMSKVQAAATLNTPRKGSNGVVTWDLVYFGRYPQSDASGKKSDPIKWRVLSVNGNDAFLAADCNLDTVKYNEQEKDVTWETCTMRSWLNGYGFQYNAFKKDYRNDNFMNRAFGAAEQNAIKLTTVKNSGNMYYNGAGSSDTKDKLFLLSYEEVTNPAYGFLAVSNDNIKKGMFGSKYISEDQAKMRKNTAYIGAGGTYGYNNLNAAGENGFWWLRTSGEYLTDGMYVGNTGRTQLDGNFVNTEFYGVCPALHLDLSNSKVWSFAGTVSSDGSSTAGEAPPVVDDTVKAGGGAVYVPTGTGTEKTIEYQQAPESGTTVKVPDNITIDGTTYTVTSIAKNAFKNNKKIKTIIIGNNVKTIGDNAFSGCSNLQSVTIGKNVTTIKSKAFYKCTKLKAITIPSKVSKIGKQAFYGCKKLRSVTIKTAKLKSSNVGSKAFKGIYSKATIKVPKKKLSAYKRMLKSKGVSSKAKIKK